MIPFNRASIVGREIEYVLEAINAGHISGDGAFSKRASAMLEEIVGGGKVLLTTSCTDALELAALLLDLGPGDEVIVPAFTFVSGVNAFALRGARPVFADVRPDTLNMDETQVNGLISEKTKAVVPVHYAGVGCDLDALVSITSSSGISLIEDNAHGLFGKYRGRPLGSFGRLATQSFHETKNVSCGEGGALVINDESLIERAEIMREKGTDRSRFFRGQVDKYTWVDLGSSFLPSDMLAAFLLGQLEQADSIQSRRRELWGRYAEALKAWAGDRGVRLPHVPRDCEHPAHLFYLVFQEPAERDSMLAHLRAREVFAVFHYLPLNVSPMGLRLGGRVGQCPIAESVSGRLLRLPLYGSLTREGQDKVIDAVVSWPG